MRGSGQQIERAKSRLFAALLLLAACDTAAHADYTVPHADLFCDPNAKVALARFALGANDDPPHYTKNQTQIGSFIRIPKPAPPADVVDQDELEIGMAAAHIRDQRLEAVAAVQGDATAPFICVRPHDGKSAPGGVGGEHVALVVR